MNNEEYWKDLRNKLFAEKVMLIMFLLKMIR